MKKIVGALVFIALVFATSFSKTNIITYRGDNYVSGDSIVVSGYIGMVGTEPFVDYVIIDDDDIRFILPSDFVEANAFEGKNVRLEAILELRELIGVSDGEKRIIKHLKPVGVEVF